MGAGFKNTIMGKSRDMFMEMREREMFEEEQQALSHGLTIKENNLLNMDAATIDTIAKAIVKEVQEGSIDPMDCLIYAKKGAAFFKAIDDNVKEFAYAKQYATKGNPYHAHSCTVEQAELGVKYDYKTAADPEYTELNDKFEKAKAAKEAREKFLKTIKNKLTTVNDDTGEVSTIYEPVKSGQLGYKITIN